MVNRKRFKNICINMCLVILLLTAIYSINLMQCPYLNVKNNIQLSQDNVYRYCDTYLSSDLIICKEEITNAIHQQNICNDYHTVRKIIAFIFDTSSFLNIFIMYIIVVEDRIGALFKSFIIITFIHKSDGKKKCSKLGFADTEFICI